MVGPPGSRSTAWESQTSVSNTDRKVLVYNVSATATEHDLRPHLEKAGPVRRVDIVQNAVQAGYPLTSALVEYEHPVSVDMALSYLGHRSGDETLNPAQPLPQAAAEPTDAAALDTQVSPDDDEHLYCVFVGDLAAEVDNEALARAFSQFPLYDARVIRCPQTMASRGYGFVRFRRESHAMEAIASMSGKCLNERAMRVNWAARPREPYPGPRTDSGRHTRAAPLAAGLAQNPTTIHLGNLPPQASLHDIMPIFAMYCDIIQAQIFPGRQYAFVTFQHHASATHAYQMLLHSSPQLQGYRLKVGWARFPGLRQN